MPTEAPNRPPGAAQPGRYLTFTLGRESYGVPVLNVREIIRICPITPVPKMPAFIKGVINLRGKVIPIFDLRAKFQLAPAADSERACIIVIQMNEGATSAALIGAIVDAVEEVAQLSAADLEATPDFGGSPNTEFILGMATVHGGVKTLLNLERIFLEEGPIALASLSPAASPIQTP